MVIVPGPASPVRTVVPSTDPRPELPDDSPGFDDIPPSEEDRRWWSEHAPRLDPPIDDYSDFMAWLDRWHHLEWCYYPGEGNWSDRNPCLPS